MTRWSVLKRARPDAALSAVSIRSCSSEGMTIKALRIPGCAQGRTTPRRRFPYVPTDFLTPVQAVAFRTGDNVLFGAQLAHARRNRGSRRVSAAAGSTFALCGESCRVAVTISSFPSGSFGSIPTGLPPASLMNSIAAWPKRPSGAGWRKFHANWCASDFNNFGISGAAQGFRPSARSQHGERDAESAAVAVNHVNSRRRFPFAGEATRRFRPRRIVQARRICAAMKMMPVIHSVHMNWRS